MTAPRRFLRTCRFDDTDELVYEPAAHVAEWAIPGGFAFASLEESQLRGRLAQAFRNGFLGLSSFGWSTFVEIAAIEAAQIDELTERLARHFVEHYGTPDLQAALPAAREEIAFAESLCTSPLGTVLSVERSLTGEGVRERFRVIRPGAGGHARIWEMV